MFLLIIMLWMMQYHSLSVLCFPFFPICHYSFLCLRKSVIVSTSRRRSVVIWGRWCDFAEWLNMPVYLMMLNTQTWLSWYLARISTAVETVCEYENYINRNVRSNSSVVIVNVLDDAVASYSRELETDITSDSYTSLGIESRCPPLSCDWWFVWYVWDVLNVFWLFYYHCHCQREIPLMWLK